MPAGKAEGRCEKGRFGGTEAGEQGESGGPAGDLWLAATKAWGVAVQAEE
jgi:hypothetical protein